MKIKVPILVATLSRLPKPEYPGQSLNVPLIEESPSYVEGNTATTKNQQTIHVKAKEFGYSRYLEWVVECALK
jgi:hypothetical protein